MAVFLKPQQLEYEINSTDFVDETLTPITEGIQVDRVSNKHYRVDLPEGSMLLAKGMYTKAFNAGQYLKFDPANSQRIKRQSENMILRNPNNNSSPLSAYNPDDINIAETLLKDVEWDEKMFIPITTGTYLDHFVSRHGGIMPGTNIMITGDAGIGKSSNMMEILTKVKKENPGKQVAYISAEMEREDLKEFLAFYKGLDAIPFLFLGDYMYEDDGTPVWQVLASFLAKGYDIVVLDSLVEIQSIVREELELSSDKKAEAHMLKILRTHNKGNNREKAYTAFLCIQQQNKGGDFVGSNRLKHMTTAFLQLKWDAKEKGKRYMVFEKNRKGKEKVKLYYSFGNDGEGIQYDEKRHTQELEILERLQATDSPQIETIGEDDFEAWVDSVSRGDDT